MAVTASLVVKLPPRLKAEGWKHPVDVTLSVLVRKRQKASRRDNYMCHLPHVCFLFKATCLKGSKKDSCPFPAALMAGFYTGDTSTSQKAFRLR